MVEEHTSIETVNEEEKPAKRKVGRPSKPKEPKEPKEPKPKITDDPDYFKKYYKNKMVKCIICPRCEKVLTSTYSYNKHINNGLYCLKYNIKKMTAVADLVSADIPKYKDFTFERHVSIFHDNEPSKGE